MPALVECTGCHRQLRIPETALGKSVRCPGCGVVFTARNGEPEAPVEMLLEDDHIQDGPGPAEPVVDEERAVSEKPLRRSRPLDEDEPVVRRRRAAYRDDGDDAEDEEDDRGGRAARSRPVAKSRGGSGNGLVITLSIVGCLLLLGGLGAGAFFLLKGGGGIPDSEWKEFASGPGQYKVLMPGAPMHRTQPQVVPLVGMITFQMDMVERRQEDCAFVAGYADYPPNLINPALEKQVLDFGALGGAAGAGGKLVSSKDITLDGFHGKEMEIDIPNKGKLVGRIYLVRNRLYMLLAAGSKITPSSPDALKFLDSFKLDPQAINPPVAPPPLNPPVGPGPGQPANPPTTPDIPDSEWRDFSNAQGNYHVKLPGIPRAPFSVLGVGFQYKLTGLDRDAGKVIYAVGYTDLTAQDLQNQSWNARFRQFKDDVPRSLPGSQVKVDVPVLFNNKLGRVYRIDIPNQGTRVVRLLPVTQGEANRLFLLVAQGPGYTESSRDVGKFFDSFGVDAPKTSAIPDSDWQEVRPPGAQCRVLLPGRAASSLRTQFGPGGRVLLRRAFVQRPGINGPIFVLCYGDLRGNPRNPVQEKRLLEWAAEGGNPEPAQRVVSSTAISLSGHPGREVVYELPGRPLVGRAYLVNSRVYAVFAAGPGISASSPDVTKFFGSFQLDKDAGVVANGNPPPLTAPTPNIPAEDWKPYAPSGQTFQVLLPGEAVTQNRVRGVVVHGVERDNGRVAFSVGYQDIAVRGPRVPSTRARYAAALNSVQAGLPGSLVRAQRVVVFNGRQGREYELSLPDSRGVVVRFFNVRKSALRYRFYILLAAGPGYNARTADVQKFLNSFQFQRTKQPGATGRKPAGEDTAQQENAAPAKDRLTFEPAAKVDRFLAPVVAKEAEVALVANADGQLWRYSYPDFKPKGWYTLSAPAYRAALDEENGLLYLAVSNRKKLPTGLPRGWALGQGDLHIYKAKELLDGDVGSAITLKPLAVIELDGSLQALTLSPDGKWLYYLDVKDPQAPKLGRVNTLKRKKEGEATLEEGTQCLCLTRDGKKLYAGAKAGADKGKVLVIDPTSLQVQKTHPVGFAPFSLDATDRGLVFFSNDVAQHMSDLGLLDAGSGTVVDKWARCYGQSFVKLRPDQKTLFVGNQALLPPRIDCWAVPKKPGDRALRAGVLVYKDEYPTGGEFFFSPDGKYLLSQAGGIIRVTAKE